MCPVTNHGQPAPASGRRLFNFQCVSGTPHEVHYSVLYKLTSCTCTNVRVHKLDYFYLMGYSVPTYVEDTNATHRAHQYAFLPHCCGGTYCEPEGREICGQSRHLRPQEQEAGAQRRAN